MAIDMQGEETKDVASCPLFPFKKNFHIPKEEHVHP
jgi:hypothetical protein